MLDFPWASIEQYEVDDEGMSFNFEYTREGRKSRWVKIFSSYVSVIFFIMFHILYVVNALIGE